MLFKQEIKMCARRWLLFWIFDIHHSYLQAFERVFFFFLFYFILAQSTANQEMVGALLLLSTPWSAISLMNNFVCLRCHIGYQLFILTSRSVVKHRYVSIGFIVDVDLGQRSTLPQWDGVVSRVWKFIVVNKIFLGGNCESIWSWKSHATILACHVGW